MIILYILALLALFKILEYLWDKIRFKHVNEGTVVLITGGCQGLGKELALVYAAHHCHVVI